MTRTIPYTAGAILIPRYDYRQHWIWPDFERWMKVRAPAYERRFANLEDCDKVHAFADWVRERATCEVVVVYPR